MPVEEILEGFFRVAIRLIFHFFVEIVFEVIFKAPGFLIAGVLSKKREGPSKNLILAISLIFWVLVVGAIYYYVYER